MRRLKNTKLLFSSLLLIFRTSSVWCQCVPTGATPPSTLANNAAVGSVTWSNLSNAISSNNSYASCGILLGILGTAQTNYIQALNCGLAIPSTATVCGIEVQVERSAAGLLIGSSVKDQNLFLVKAGAQVGSNHASSSNWAGSDAIAVYGNNADLWGTTWTPAQINASNFGVQLSAQMNAGLASLFLTANVDAIAITVYYTTGTLPVELISFSGQQESQTIRLEWRTASEKNNAYFDVEKMDEHYGWNIIETLAGKGNSSSMTSYTLYDQNPETLNYYRIRQVDVNKQSSLSETISVEYKTGSGNKPKVYPIPANSILHIDSQSPIQSLEIISSKGFEMQAELQQQETGAQINIASLAPGIYFLKMYTRTEVIMTRFVKE
jgi:hypothetical protein